MNERNRQTRGAKLFTRRAWIMYLVVGLLCVFPIVTFFRRRRQKTVLTEITTFFKPVGLFGVFGPCISEDDKNLLNCVGAENRFVKVKEVRFAEFYEDACDVMLQIEFIGEVLEQARYQFELQALDIHGNVVASSWLETQDKRLVTRVQNESDFAKKLGGIFLPVITISFGTGMSREDFDKIARVELSTTRVLL